MDTRGINGGLKGHCFMGMPMACHPIAPIINTKLKTTTPLEMIKEFMLENS